MRKKDLKSGMIVEVRDKRKFLVVFSHHNEEHPLTLIGENRWVDIMNYGDDLIYLPLRENELDIMKVWKYRGPAGFSSLIEWEFTLPDWVRNKEIELTLKEIEEELGYRIKIIRGE